MILTPQGTQVRPAVAPPQGFDAAEASWPALASDTSALWDHTGTVNTDGDGVVSWEPTSGGGTGTRRSTARSPAAATVDGQPAINFTAANRDVLDVGSAPATAFPFLLTVVGRLAGGVSNATPWAAIGDADGGVSQRAQLQTTVPAGLGLVRGYTNLRAAQMQPDPTIAADGNVHVLTLIANSFSDLRVYLDGVRGTDYSGAGPAISGWDAASLGGALDDSANTYDYLDGDLCAVQVCTGRTFGDADAAAIVAAARTVWSSIP